MADTATYSGAMKTTYPRAARAHAKRKGRGHGGAAMRKTAAGLRAKGYDSEAIRRYFHKHGHPHRKSR